LEKAIREMKMEIPGLEIDQQCILVLGFVDDLNIAEVMEIIT